jgi:hypothetical protein
LSDQQPVNLVEPWPLSLTRKRPLVSALIVGSVAFAAFWLSGAAFGDVSPWDGADPRLATGMSLTYTVLLAYLVGIAAYAADKVKEFGHSLAPELTDGGQAVLDTLNHVPAHRLWAATAVGLVLAALNSNWDIVVTYDGTPRWLVHLSLTLGSTLVWIVGARLIYLQARNGRLFSQVGREHTRVDLFATDGLAPFARTGLLGLFFTMGALAITPLQALDAQFRLENYFWAIAVTLPAGVTLLLLPMWGIHQRLKEEKAHALGEIDAAIAATDQRLEVSALNRLNALTTRRALLKGVHEWPLDVRAVSRVGFYLIIPPLAWIAAALVEMALERAL